MICKNLKSHILNLKLIVCLGLLIVSSPSFSQQKKDTAKSTKIVKHKILLVPVKTTMIMSEIGKAVNASTHLTYAKIMEAFRSRLDLAIYTAFKQNYTTISFLQDKKKADTTLGYIYSSIGYKYDLLPGQDSSGENHAEFDPKLQKTNFIKKGQLQVPIDYSKRFMNVSFANPHLLSYLNKKEGADIFIFINELDIKNVANTPTEDLTASNFRREVMVQYSIVNSQKQYIAKGILTTYFPSNVNDPKVIGEKYFAVIAQAMLKEFVSGLQKNQTIKNTPGAVHHKKAPPKKK
jgi:hypothetical protein